MRFIVAFVFSLFAAGSAFGQSTINPALPQSGLPYSSTPIRNNFQAAYNDINSLFTASWLTATAPLSLSGTTLSISPFSSSTAGTVPASGGGTTNFLRADGTFAIPPGNITATLPLSLSGNTLSISTFTNLAAGTVPASGGGTTNFLRADGTFAVPPGTISGPGSAAVNDLACWDNTNASRLNDCGFPMQPPGTTVNYNANSGSDAVGCGSSGTPCRTATYALNLACESLKTVGFPVLVQGLTNDSAETSVLLCNANGAASGNTSATAVIWDGGGFAVPPITGLGATPPIVIQHMIVDVITSTWCFEGDNGSNIWIGNPGNPTGSGVTCNLGSGAAGAVLANDRAQVVFYGILTVTGTGGPLFQASDGGHIHYEPSNIVLSGTPNINPMVNLLRGGTVDLFNTTFSGGVSSANALATDGDLTDRFYAPNGITWPSGVTVQSNTGGILTPINAVTLVSPASTPGFILGHAAADSDFSIGVDAANTYFLDQHGAGVFLFNVGSGPTTLAALSASGGLALGAAANTLSIAGSSSGAWGLTATSAGNPVIEGLPTSAGSGGLVVCVDTSGQLYKKSSCP